MARPKGPPKKSFTFKHTEPLYFESSNFPVCDRVYVGIDQSLVCTSVAILHQGKMEVHQIRPSTRDISRLIYVTDEFNSILGEKAIDAAAIEGYAMAGTGRVFGLGELGGVLRVALYHRKTNTIEVPPKSLKKFLTGNGNSTKEMMIHFLGDVYGLDVKDDNDSDAIALALAAHEYFENEEHFFPQYQIYIQVVSAQIIGKHPRPMDPDKYLAELGDQSVADLEKKRRGGAKKPVVRAHKVKK